jgi:hypothetical protein
MSLFYILIYLTVNYQKVKSIHLSMKGADKFWFYTENNKIRDGTNIFLVLVEIREGLMTLRFSLLLLFSV